MTVTVTVSTADEVEDIAKAHTRCDSCPLLDERVEKAMQWFTFGSRRRCSSTQTSQRVKTRPQTEDNDDRSFRRCFKKTHERPRDQCDIVEVCDSKRQEERKAVHVVIRGNSRQSREIQSSCSSSFVVVFWLRWRRHGKKRQASPKQAPLKSPQHHSPPWHAPSATCRDDDSYTKRRWLDNGNHLEKLFGERTLSPQSWPARHHQSRQVPS